MNLSSTLRQWCLPALLMVCTGVLCVGCPYPDTRPSPVQREVFRQPYPSHVPEKPRYEGSLFQGESRYTALFADRRAHLMNDVVTVRIVESSTASGEATTEADRTSTVQGSLEGLFGFEDKVIRNNGVDPAMLLQGSLTSGFDGSGSTARKNTLNATITAVVREVFPNGTLYIEGRKEVVINNERQYIILSGIIRPDDIQTDNSIASDRIADARVVYSGSGAVSDKQRPGWFGRVIDLVWPF